MLTVRTKLNCFIWDCIEGKCKVKKKRYIFLASLYLRIKCNAKLNDIRVFSFCFRSHIKFNYTFTALVVIPP